MVHYADGEPDSVLASTAYALRNVAAHQLFSLADGDVVVRFGNGQALSFGGSEELASITIERADGDALQEDGWLDAEEPPFRDFHVWIAARLGFSSSTTGWKSMLLERAGDESAAFDRFFLELDAFRRGA